MCCCWACIWHWKSVLFLWCNRNIYLFYNFLLHLANISNYFTILLCWSDAWYWFFIMARAPWYWMPWENLCLINKYISCHVINMLFPAFFSSWWQYFKMDPENYDNYGGVVVISIFMLLKVGELVSAVFVYSHMSVILMNLFYPFALGFSFSR